MIATRARRLFAAGAVVGAALLAVAPSAVADPVSDAVAALRVGRVYLAPEITTAKLDSGLSAALPNDIRIAVLPASAGSGGTLSTEIGRDLGAGPQRPLTIAVVTVGPDGRIAMRAASSKYCPGQADAQAQAATDAARSQAPGGAFDLTPVIQDFVQLLSEARVDRGDCPRDAAAGARSNATAAWVWVGGIAAVCAAGVGGLLRYRRRKRQRDLDLARARVMPYYDRLASEVTTLEPNDSAKAAQALADASERFTTAGAQLASADAVEQYVVVRRTVLEGLHAARAARDALGIDPGPSLPAPDPSDHDQLNEAQQVSVQGQQFQGYPSYTQGAPYYYGGGYGVPGGWYGVPFWETLLLGSLLSGGMSGYGADGDGYDA